MADESERIVDELLASTNAQDSWPATPATTPWLTLYRNLPTLVKQRPRDIVDLLITALGAPTRQIHQPAASILHHLTGADHGFRVYDPPAARLAAQQSWADWWRGQDTSVLHPDALGEATLVVDEIPGRIVGDDDEPPGRLVLLDRAGATLWANEQLKMPYDAVRLPDGRYYVNIIRARAVWELFPDGTIGRQQPVGGYPCSLQLLPNGNLLVAGWDDDVPGFVREFTSAGQIVWQLEDLRWPWYAQRLPDEHTLIADAGTGRVYEVDAAGNEVWAAANLGPEEPELFDALGPIYCQRLYDGNTIVSIRAHSRIVELDPAGQVVWELGAPLLANQYAAVRLWNGNTLIADAGHFRVIEVDCQGEIVWERGGFGYPAKAYRCAIDNAPASSPVSTPAN